MRIDLHVHTAERSPCAVVSEENQIRAAIQAGLDGIAITDHDQLVPRERLVALNKAFAPFKIFTGIEVGADQLHWIVLGIHDRLLERRDWSYPHLLDFVRRRDGFIILAHPFRYASELQVDLDAYPSDGIEVKSINTPASRERDIRAIAGRLGLGLFCNSDAHRPGSIGSYCNLLPRPVCDDQGLIEALSEMKPERQGIAR